MPSSLTQAIQNFPQNDLKSAALTFWQSLGYSSNRTLDLAPDPKTFTDFFKIALPPEFQQIALLFQLSGDDIQTLRGQNPLFSGEFETSEEKSYIFLALQLDPSKNYSRTELSNFARLLNKPFGSPVLLLIHHGDLLSLAIVDRRPNKLDASRDVLERVTLLKDIRLADPHGGQLKILRDLAFSNLPARNWDELHAAWKKILDLNELNRSFFRELSDWYFHARHICKFPQPDSDTKTADEHASTSVIRLITRVMFAYFLRERDLVPSAIFEPARLQELLKPDAGESSYYRAVLQNLFFATLGTEIPERGWMPPQNGGRNTGFMVHNKRRYQDYFHDPAAATAQLFDRVPFLNGGLFECLDKRVQIGGKEVDERFDGFSQNPKNQGDLRVPNSLFWGESIAANLNADYGDTRHGAVAVRPLLEIFARYKFTVAENTPLEEEVALDPELLGKVFENLLASYNPETASTARKQTGSFYTPREIVDYMVEESLVAYLTSATGIEEGMVRGLFASPPPQPSPASGRGSRSNAASPETPTEGETDRLPLPLAGEGWGGGDATPNSSQTQSLIAALEKCTILDPACGSGAFPMGCLGKLVHLLERLDPQNTLWRAQLETTAALIPIAETRENYLQSLADVFERDSGAYARKLFLIQKCLFGVDIQPIAIQIAKLRFFIALAIEQTCTGNEAQNFGIRPLPNLETKLVAANTLLGLSGQLTLSTPESTKLRGQLEKVRADHFSAPSWAKKKALRDRDADLRARLKSELETIPGGEDAAAKLAAWNPYDQNQSAAFFDPQWMFGINSGFDIVIGNPPYVRPHKLSDEFKKRLWERYTTFEKKADLYCCFIESGVNLLSEGANLTFIVSNSILRLDSFEAMRNFLLRQTQLKFIVDYEGNVFETAAVKTCILQAVKATSKENVVKAAIIAPSDSLKTVVFNPIRQDKFVSNYKNIFDLSSAEDADNVKQKIRGKHLLLGVTFDLSFGLKTGDDSKFLGNSKTTKDHKKLLRGEDIGTYKYKFAGEYVWFVPLQMRAHRATARPGTKERFEQPKVLVRDTGGKLSVTFDNENFYVKDVIIVSDKSKNAANLKMLVGILNSRMMRWFYETTFPTLHVQRDELAQLPIPTATPAQQEPIISLVESILAAKKLDALADVSGLELQIDALVFALYGLSDEETALVLGA